MVIKRYRCNVGNFSFSVVIGGKQKWLIFSGSKSDEGFYSTGNIAEQTAIESSRRYKRGGIVCIGSYALPDEKDETPEEVPTPQEVVRLVTEVNTVQEAREWLIEHCGAKAGELPNKEAVLSRAEREGVKFANL